MNNRKSSTRYILLGLLVFVIALAARPANASQKEANQPAPLVPEGFHLVRSAPGVQLYRKDYPKGNPDFVQVINLSQGAQVRLMHGPITDPGEGKGINGGNDPRFKSLSLENFWQDFSLTHPSAFCVTNGQFFYMPEEPTRIAFSLKVDGVILSDGWGLKQFSGNKLMLELWPGRANITEFTSYRLYHSTAPDVIGGLTEAANKNAKKYVGRTFIGVDDQDADGTSEILLVFNTLSARQVDAAEVLRDFGAERVMMLDGGGSTQLICEGEQYVSSDRYIPQALGVAAGPAPTPTPRILKLERVHNLPKSTNMGEISGYSPEDQALEKTSNFTSFKKADPAIVKANQDSLATIAVLPLSALIFLILMRLLHLHPKEKM